jgi:hypothetical protein
MKQTDHTFETTAVALEFGLVVLQHLATKSESLTLLCLCVSGTTLSRPHDLSDARIGILFPMAHQAS